MSAWTRFRDKLTSRLLAWLGFSTSADPATGDAPAETPPAAPAARPVAGSLVFRFGGFRGEGAAEDPATQISDVRISRGGLSYRWTKGDLGNWGLSRENDGALACAFYWDGAQWIGGKFDWISTSRTTRDFKNIDGGYNGWRADLFWAAPRRAFCIVSADGKKRTNLEEAK